MIAYIGNCQASMVRDVADAPEASRFFRLYTTRLPLHTRIRDTKNWLLGHYSNEMLSILLKNGVAGIQPSLDDIKEARPDLLAVNLFHESDAYQHRTHGFILSIEREELDKFAALREIIARDFFPVPNVRYDYLDRFAELLAALRQALPGTPLVVLKRLSHFNAFQNRGYSLLYGWDDMWRECAGHAGLTPEVGATHVLDFDRLAGKLFHETGSISSFASNIRLRRTDRYDMTHYDMLYDLEHLDHAVYASAAAKLSTLQRTGVLHYQDSERVPDAWLRSEAHSGQERGQFSFHGETVRLLPDGDVHRLLTSRYPHEQETGYVQLLLRLPQKSAALIQAAADSLYPYANATGPLLEYVKLSQDAGVLPVIRGMRKRLVEEGGQASSFLAHSLRKLDEMVDYLEAQVPARSVLGAKHKAKCVAVWGTGGAACLLLKKMRAFQEHSNICGFIEGLVQTTETFEGFAVRRPDELANLEPDLVIVASTYFKEIAARIGEILGPEALILDWRELVRDYNDLGQRFQIS